MAHPILHKLYAGSFLFPFLAHEYLILVEMSRAGRTYSLEPYYNSNLWQLRDFTGPMARRGLHRSLPPSAAAP